MNPGVNVSEPLLLPKSVNAPNGRDVALDVSTNESRSASVALTVNVRVEFSTTVWFPIGASIGITLTFVTFSVNISISLVIPSVTVTLIG